ADRAGELCAEQRAEDGGRGGAEGQLLPAESVHREPPFMPSSAMLICSTFTTGSLRNPHCEPVVYWCTSAMTRAAGRCLAAATRGAWSRALATEMSGSRPDPDAVTASTGTAAPAGRWLKAR